MDTDGKAFADKAIRAETRATSPAKEVPSALDNLSYQLEQLGKVVEKLEVTLAPLQIPMPETPQDSSVQMFESELAGAIQARVNAMERFNDRLNGLAFRTQI